MKPDRVIRRRAVERDALIERAAEWVRSLPPGLGLEAAAVFGSVARGDFNRWSDVDLLLIATGFEGSPLRRLEQLGDRPPASSRSAGLRWNGGRRRSAGIRSRWRRGRWECGWSTE